MTDLNRSRKVHMFVDQQKGRLVLEFLPAYAPELNPVEYLWGYWKHHAFSNFCPKTFGELSGQARQALRRMCGAVALWCTPSGSRLACLTE